MEDRCSLGELGRRAKEDPRVRHLPYLGWSVILVPVDVMPSRSAARMLVGTFGGFEPDELVSLRARRFAFDGEPERTWWVIAVRSETMQQRGAPRRRNG